MHWNDCFLCQANKFIIFDILTLYKGKLTIMIWLNNVFLSFQYGLYSAFMGCFVYVIFGSCKDITIGPTAIMAIMTHEYSKPDYPQYAILLCFLSGVIIFAAGIINLGKLEIILIGKSEVNLFLPLRSIT